MPLYNPVPVGSTSAAGLVQLDGTAADIAPDGTTGGAGAVGKAADAGHIHANRLALPGDFAFVAWTFDPGLCNAAAGAPSTSTLYLVQFTLRAAATLTNVSIHVTTLSSTLNSNQNFVAVYDSGGTCRAVTADQTSAWGSTGVKTTAFGGAYAAAAGSYYLAVNVSVASSTGPVFRCSTAVASNFLANTGLSASTLRIATQAGLGAIPTAGSGTITLSSNVQTNATGICAVFT